MRRTPEQQSWIISIACHIVVVLALSISWHNNQPKQPDPYPVVSVQLVQPTQPKVMSKHLVRKAPKPKAKVAKKPTSLPGDRSQPAASRSFQPVYPKKALNNDWEGTVKVQVTVAATGKPIAVQVLRSSGHPSLDNAFVRSIKQQGSFKPKRVMGKNVSGTIVLTHTFSLQGPS
ncbi:MAG: TonB family protein [Candidatus Marinamargulisbacteria bacterium]